MLNSFQLLYLFLCFNVRTTKSKEKQTESLRMTQIQIEEKHKRFNF